MKATRPERSGSSSARSFFSSSAVSALPRLVAGRERDGDDFVHPSSPEAGADCEPERFPENDQLLRDRRVRGALGAATRDVSVHVESSEPRERKPDVLAPLVGLEHADQVARLGAVGIDRVRAPPPSRDLLLVQGVGARVGREG